jgi:hypothetical protein
MLPALPINNDDSHHEGSRRKPGFHWLDRISTWEGISENSTNPRELQKTGKQQAITQAMDETPGGVPYPNISLAMVIQKLHSPS